MNSEISQEARADVSVFFAQKHILVKSDFHKCRREIHVCIIIALFGRANWGIYKVAAAAKQWQRFVYYEII